MMGTDDALLSTSMGDDAKDEDGYSLLIRSLEMEVLSLRRSEASLIEELQRRCDKAIDLEVQLDHERARGNRLEREKKEEDEALSGELREIMATVTVGSPPGTPAAAADAVDPIDTEAQTSKEGEGAKSKSNSASATAANCEGPAGDEVKEGVKATGGGSEEQKPQGELPSASAGGGSGGPGFFGEWRLRLDRTRANDGIGENGKDDGEQRAGGGGEPTSTTIPTSTATAGDDGNGGSSATAGGPAAQATATESLSAPASGGGEPGGSGGSGFFAEWRMRRARRASNGGDDGGDNDEAATKSNNNSSSSNNDGRGDEKQNRGGGSTPTTAAEDERSVGEESKAGGIESKGLPPRGRGREKTAGALRTRIVELELLRAEADDLIKEKTDRSIRLEVQVEQLKNIVQSLSHASPVPEKTQGLGRKGYAKTGTRRGVVDLDPLLRDIPGVDPSVLLQLHRSPWADGVIEGIREEVACFEWQGRDSRGDWSSKLGTLPTELSSLPYHPTGPPPPSPPVSHRSRTLCSPHASVGRTASVSSRNSSPGSRSPSPPVPGSGSGSGSGSGAVESKKDDEQQTGAGGGAGTGGLREKFGGAVAALGLGGGGGPAAGGRMVTDEGVTLRFGLDEVALPSDHWEWVGSWVVDSEMEASADEDGWIYGRTPSEIGEIALGRTSSTGDSGTSASTSLTAVRSAASGGSAAPATSSQMNGVGLDPQQKQQQEQQQQGIPLDAPVTAEGGATPEPSSDSAENADTDGPLEKDKVEDGVEGGAPLIVRERDGGTGEGAGAGGEKGAKGGSNDRGNGSPSLRRRRLVRLRMVGRVDGAGESTAGVMALIRRICSLEILVRKLSGQVVLQQRQVTGLESQVASLAPLYPRLRKACALGRRDRQRGNILERKLVEAENELKVLRRCMAAANIRQSAPTLRRAASPAPAATTNGPVPGGIPADQGKVAPAGAEESDEGGSAGGGSEAWGWVEGMAQRAAGTFARRPRPVVSSPAKDSGEPGVEGSEEGPGGEEQGGANDWKGTWKRL